MKTFLATISLLILSVWTCATYAQESATSTEYSVVIDARGKQITGICVMNAEEDGSVVGTIVNEIGIRAFDFTFDGRKAKVHDVFPPINKWYIRKVLRKDMTFLLTNINIKQNVVRGKREITVLPNGDVDLANHRYHIRYTFKLLVE